MAYPTSQVRFEWDAKKNDENRKKHGIAFEEAKALFEQDADYLEIYDEAHSQVEERFIAIGPLKRGVVVIVWMERVEDVVRIISARFATRQEIELYHEFTEAK